MTGCGLLHGRVASLYRANCPLPHLPQQHDQSLPLAVLPSPAARPILPAVPDPHRTINFKWQEPRTNHHTRKRWTWLTSAAAALALAGRRMEIGNQRRRWGSRLNLQVPGKLLCSGGSQRAKATNECVTLLSTLQLDSAGGAGVPIGLVHMPGWQGSSLVHLVKVFREHAVALARLVRHAAKKDGAALVRHQAEAGPRLRGHARPASPCSTAAHAQSCRFIFLTRLLDRPAALRRSLPRL